MALRKAMASVSVARASKPSVYIAHVLRKADLVSVALHFEVFQNEIRLDMSQVRNYR
jgi:hypothetical protein